MLPSPRHDGESPCRMPSQLPINHPPSCPPDHRPDRPEAYRSGFPPGRHAPRLHPPPGHRSGCPRVLPPAFPAVPRPGCPRPGCPPGRSRPGCPRHRLPSRCRARPPGLRRGCLPGLGASRLPSRPRAPTLCCGAWRTACTVPTVHTPTVCASRAAMPGPAVPGAWPTAASRRPCHRPHRPPAEPGRPRSVVRRRRPVVSPVLRRTRPPRCPSRPAAAGAVPGAGRARTRRRGG